MNPGPNFNNLNNLPNMDTLQGQQPVQPVPVTPVQPAPVQPMPVQPAQPVPVTPVQQPVPVQPVAPVQPVPVQPIPTVPTVDNNPYGNNTNNMTQAPIMPNNQNLQFIPNVEQSNEQFINNTVSSVKKEEPVQENKVNFTFVIVLFVIILAIVFFVFPMLLNKF